MKKIFLIASILYNFFTLGIYNVNVINLITISYIIIYGIIKLNKINWEEV